MKNIRAILGLLIVILVSLFFTQIHTGLIRADIKKLVTPIPKEDSVVEIIGFQGTIETGRHSLLINDAGTSRFIRVDEKSKLGSMSNLPRFLKKVWIERTNTFDYQAVTDPVTMIDWTPENNYDNGYGYGTDYSYDKYDDGYYDSGYGIDYSPTKPDKNPVEEKK
jgi:hypothetical protein